MQAKVKLKKTGAAFLWENEINIRNFRYWIHVQRELNGIIRTTWQEEWNNPDKGRHLHQIIPNIRQWEEVCDTELK